MTEAARGAGLIRPASPGDCSALSALRLRAKASHGYGPRELAAFAPELAVTPQTLARGHNLVALAGRRPLGFAQIASEAGDVWLDALFVDPPAMGQGIGTALFDRSTILAGQSGARQILIASDPGAAGFYLARGAVRCGEVASHAIPGRMLPRFVYTL
ncbi:MAG: GNAT family N-acetyltransferase [Pseudomonadota bacterium]